MRDIVIKTIPHKEQRYDTIGDYWIDENNVLQFRVSEMDDASEWLVIMHELIEQFLTGQRGITGEVIDKFDMDYEKNRTEDSLEEPGDNQAAPYYKEHQFATAVERLLCTELGLDWNTYYEESLQTDDN